MSNTQQQKSEDQAVEDVVKSDEDVWNELDAEEAPADEDADDTFRQVDEDPEQIEQGAEAADEAEAADIPDGDDEKSEAGGDADEVSDDLDPVALREQNERLEKQFRSEQNRAVGQQRRADRLQKRVEQLEAKINGQGTADSQPNAEDDDAIKQVAEEYPDVAGPLVKRMQELQDRLNTASPEAAADLEDARQELEDLEAEEVGKFEAEHKDGFAVINEHPELFRQWVEDQPKQYRDIFERNRQNMVDGLGAALLVSRFKNDLLNAEQDTEVDEQSETSQRLTTRRQRQLSGARTTTQRNKTTKIVSDEPAGDMSAEDAWDYWDRKDAQAKA